MSYRVMRSKKVRITFDVYPWDYTAILRGMLEAMFVLKKVGDICQPNEYTLRKSEAVLAFERTIEILDILVHDKSDTWDEEDKFFNELWPLLQGNLRGWWD